MKRILTASCLFTLLLSQSLFAQEAKVKEALDVAEKLDEKDFLFDNDKSCLQPYYRKAKKVNYTVSLAAGAVGAVLVAPAMPVLGGLVRIASSGLILGGSIGLASDLLREKNPGLSEKIEDVVSKISPEHRPLITMPFAKPYYEVAETIAISYALLADQTGGITEHVIANSYKSLMNKQEKVCRNEVSEKGLEADYIQSLENNISSSEAKLETLSDESPHKILGREFLSCLKNIKIGKGEKTFTLYDYYKFSEENKLDKHHLKMVQSFAKVYSDVMEDVQKPLSPQKVAMAIVKADDKFVYCKNLKKPMKRKDLIKQLKEELKLK